jgi:hypothetical protein
MMIATVLAIYGAFFIYSLPDVLANNKRLNHLDQEFLLIKHPESTEYIKREKRMGLLDGNSNHCDYFVGELRTYNDSKEHICQFYQDITIRDQSNTKFAPGLWVEFPKSSEISGSVFTTWKDVVYNTPEDEIFGWCSQSEVEQGEYIVYIYFQDLPNRVVA